MMQGYQRMTKLPRKPRVYANDTNLLSFMFQAARNDRILSMLLTEIQFIRENPQLSEEQVRRQLELDAIRNLPVKPNGKLTER